MGKYPAEGAVYKKLVRDKIPEITRSTGMECEIRILDDDEVIEQLKIKAVEESQELIEAEGLPDTKKEMSDVLQIIVSLAQRLGIPMDEIEALRAEREAKRGGFDKGIFLEKTYRP
jgi:predicted house-cleaning noncanonical NTP pyrophosphatase (MazG superfamily)